MSLYYYSENENTIEMKESLDKYKYLFSSCFTKLPSLTEALNHMFKSSGKSIYEANILTQDILFKTKNIIDVNFSKISEKYPNISKDDAQIISSYTCESKDISYSPYKLLNENLSSNERENAIKKITKYLFILLKSLRKLEKYHPKPESKNLYRCIKSKVNLKFNPMDRNTLPYQTGNIKTFWGFSSASTDINNTFNFLKGDKDKKSGTIFSLTEDVWGYDISLFNYYGEEEILIEPERMFIVDEVIPTINDLIFIRCKIQNTPIILLDVNYDNNYNINNLDNNNEHNNPIHNNYNIINNIAHNYNYNNYNFHNNNEPNYYGKYINIYYYNNNENINIGKINQDKEGINIESLYLTEDGRVIFKNGLLRGIIHKYAEIDKVVSRIQDILLKGVTFRLEYKAFDIGDKAKDFHEKCDNLKMSLVLIETDKDIRFGGFTTRTWEGNCIKKFDNNAFIFSLETNKIFDIIPKEPAIGCYPKFGPIFLGCQIRIFDGFFTNYSTTFQRRRNYKTNEDYELNNGKEKYLIKDIEVYSVEI